MRRYWISKEYMHPAEAPAEAHITGDIFHHIVGVCRIEVGDKFELLPGDGRAYFVEMLSIQKKSAVARVLEVREIESLRRPYIHLCVSVPRFQTLEVILEKAVELGVLEVVPFVSDHSFVRSVGEPLRGKRKRWLKIIQGATEQCGRGELMTLAEPETLEGILKKFNQQSNAAGLFPYEGETELEIKDALKTIHSPSEVWVFVGSEGGFSHREVEMFRQNGLKPVTLGPQVLRVETACLALVSVIKYHFDLMK